MPPLLKKTWQDHSGTFAIVLRICAYTLCMFGCLWVAGMYFGDTYTANIGLFMLFSSLFEMLWAGTERSHRLSLYVLCLILLALAGLLLVRLSDNYLTDLSRPWF